MDDEFLRELLRPKGKRVGAFVPEAPCPSCWSRDVASSIRPLGRSGRADAKPGRFVAPPIIVEQTLEPVGDGGPTCPRCGREWRDHAPVVVLNFGPSGGLGNEELAAFVELLGWRSVDTDPETEG